MSESAYRPVATRLKDWRHVHQEPTPGHVQSQAGRCLGCGVPFCQSSYGCPVENLIPDWNQLVTTGSWREASEALHRTNNFPEFTGRLCPAPCEAACVLSLAQDPVAIRSIESAIVERAFASGWIRPETPTRSTARRVAIVGSGPAGLAAAQQLRRKGHDVTVLERDDALGGLLRYGIPDFKLEKWVLDRRLDQLRAEGVRFETGLELGRSVTLADLSGEYHAVALAVGAGESRDLRLPGRELSGIHSAMEFLTSQNRHGAGQRDCGRIDARGRRVVIIGGGDTGSDCLGTALRQGAIDVQQLELADKPPFGRRVDRPWPLLPLKFSTSHAHEEGGTRAWNVATTGFSGGATGRVERLHAVRIELVDGQPEPVLGSAFTLKTDLVLVAIGFAGVETALTTRESGLTRTGAGALSTNQDFMTSVPGVFAAGDARRGASLIVWAIAEGRRMAEAIDRYLRN